MDKKYTDDDYCDIYANRICDNCGDCLEMDGIDIRAINIEEISKSVEENKFLEDELRSLYEEAKLEEESAEVEDYELQSDMESEEEYIDAFDHIEYLDDLDVNDDEFIEEMTEEVFPGVRRLKSKK